LPPIHKTLVWKGSDLQDSHFVVQKEGVGEVELHAEPLLLVIESGEATLSAGGQKRAVAEGDAVLIPANLPHQMLVAPGKRISYRVIRQTSSEAAPAPAHFSGKKPALGIDLGSGFRSCMAGDNSPEGTVVDGYKKLSATVSWAKAAFGNSSPCRRR